MPSYIDYHLNSEVPRHFVASYVQPVIQQYKSTNVSKRISAIKVATTKITEDFRYEWKPSHAYHKIDTLL